MADGLGLLAVAAMLTGCNSNTKDENALLTEENQSLREQLSDRNNALQSAHDEMRDKDMRLAELQREVEAAQQSPQLTALSIEVALNFILSAAGKCGDLTYTVRQLGTSVLSNPPSQTPSIVSCSKIC